MGAHYYSVIHYRICLYNTFGYHKKLFKDNKNIESVKDKKCMSEKKFAVLFDTNAYRNFAHGKSDKEVVSDIQDLVKKEAQKDIKAFGSIIVGMEMLSHLSEGIDGINYQDCLNGVIALGNHCFDAIGQGLRIFPPAYLHIAQSFFSAAPQEYVNRIKDIGGVINDFKMDYNNALSYHKKRTFEDIKSYIDKEESDFSEIIIDLIEGMRQGVLKKHPRILPSQLSKKISDFINNGPYEEIIAFAIIEFVAASLQLNLTQNEISKKASSLKQEFPLSVGFYRWVSDKIVNHNIDMKSKKSKDNRWNWVWDYHVSFSVNNGFLDGREVILVTRDEDMVKMLEDFGFGSQIMELREYYEFLEN